MNTPGLERWTKLWQAAGACGDPLPWYARLAAAYSQPHRHYHTFGHIAECLGEFDTARDLARQPSAVELAIWFHDAVYDPRAPDNEEQSAALLRQCLSEAGVSDSLSEVASRLVLATKNHDAGVDVDAPVLVDVDLSILGQPAARFQEYEAQIHREYAWVPETTFAVRRAEILEGFLARARVYTTDRFYEEYERQARNNIRQSLGVLRSHG